jgi:hypothetical protein
MRSSSPLRLHARQRVGDRAFALTLKGKGSVERGGYVSDEHGGRVQIDGIHRLVREARRDDGADLDSVRTKRQPHEGRATAVAAPAGTQLEQLADDRMIDERPRGRDLGRSQVRSDGVLRAPGRQLGGGGRLVPDDDLARLHRENPGERRRGDPGDLVGFAKASDVHEEPRECREVERPASAQRLCERLQHRGERLEQLGRILGQGSLRLQVEGSDHELSHAQGHGDLRADPGERRYVVRIRADIHRVLRHSEPDGAPHHATLDPEAVRHGRIAVLGDEPEPPVLEHEDRGKHTADRLIQSADGRVDALAGELRVGARGGGGRLPCSGGENRALERIPAAGRLRHMLHERGIGSSDPLLERPRESDIR